MSETKAHDSHTQDSKPQDFQPQHFQPIVSFIWSCADTLRDVYVKGKYRDVILPMVVIRRIDAVLEPTHTKSTRTKTLAFTHTF